MKFVVEKKGEKFLVVNQDTGYVRGRFAKEGEAKLSAKHIQDLHDNEIRMSSVKVAPTGHDITLGS